MIRVAFFDTKAYDKPSFEQYGSRNDVEFKFFETKLTEDTADLAKGCDAVCVFVNDTVSDKVIDRLYENGVKMIALRCAGYNNVDVEHAYGKLHVVHVPHIHPMPLPSMQQHFFLPRFEGSTRHTTGQESSISLSAG